MTAAKRALDLAFAAAALVALAPVLLGVALWIKADSPGPVLFRQERVGRHGRPFRILKFRTMHVDAERLGPPITVGRDPRITRAGAVLRHCKLDELPQLVNVVRGEMSLVGPRPELPGYVALYPPAVREKVLSVAPGITDPASLRFIDEGAELGRAEDPARHYVESIMPRKLAIYVDYVDRRTLWGDTAIILRTAAALVRRRARG